MRLWILSKPSVLALGEGGCATTLLAGGGGNLDSPLILHDEESGGE